MNDRSARFILSLVVLAVLGTPLAHAQTRTWVSGVGNDANPCSRTAPCKTFAGAFSKTSAGGEINVLDPGGFGAVTITKAITISSEGFEAGVLVSATNGIIVNVPNAGDVVVLRGLDIEGLGSGLSGIKVVAGGNVKVEKCIIDRFSTGIDFQPTVSGSQLHVSDTTVRNNGSGVTGGGILAGSAGAATAKVSLDEVRMQSNVFGLKVQGSTNAMVSNTVATNNAFAGYSTASAASVLTIERSVAAHNATTGAGGVVCSIGTVRMNNMTISDNLMGAVVTGGSCFTSHTNNIDVAAIGGLTFATPQ